MRKLLLIAVLVAFGGGMPETAQAHLVTKPKGHSLKSQLASQIENLKHNRYVCNNGKKTWTITKLHCHHAKWLERERNDTLEFLYPPVPKWGPWAFPDSCLREISRRETIGTYSPTIYNQEVGAPNGAYGIGQALPKEKMAPFGDDYMTNPWTQLKWMIHYVNGRYGGSCAALDFHNRNGWY